MNTNDMYVPRRLYKSLLSRRLTHLRRQGVLEALVCEHERTIAALQARIDELQEQKRELLSGWSRAPHLEDD